MAGDQRHIHHPAAAEEFARALGLQVGGAGYPFVGDWATKGLYAYRSGQYNGIAYFGTGGSERDRLTMPHESEKYRPWNRYDPDIPAHIREKLVELEDDDSTTLAQPSRKLSDGGAAKGGGGGDLSGIWQSFEYATNAGPLDRYEFRRDGERYYIVRPPGGAINEGDYITFDGTIGRHTTGPTSKMLPSGELHWDIDDWKYVSRREGTASPYPSRKKGENSIRVDSREITEDARAVTPFRTGWYRIEHADGSLVERVRVHRDERKTGATNEFTATGDFTGDVTWYVEGNTVNVPQFGSTGKIQADGNITWGRDGNKAMYEGNVGDPSTGEQSIHNDVGRIALKSVHGKYLSAQPDGRAEWNRDVACDWEFFELGERDGRKITLRSTHGKYVSAQPDGAVQINRDHAPPGGWEEFTVETRPGPTPGDAHDVLRLKSVHGKYLSAQADGTVQWNRDHAPPGGWEDIQFVPQGTQNQEQARLKQHASIEILEAVTGKPIRFKLNHPPIHNDAWVGIYPPNVSDQDHGAQNNRWKWLRDIDTNNASFSRGAAGPRSIRVFSDGGYTLHARKDFVVETAEKPRRGSTGFATSIGFATFVGIFLMLPGVPLLILGSISTAEGRLAMLIPGAVLVSVGGFALGSLMRRGLTEDRSSVMTDLKAVESALTNIEVLSFNHHQPIRFKINNPPLDKQAWVGLYPSNADDRDHGDRWRRLKDIDVNDASLPGQAKGAWSIRVFSDNGYTLHERVDFELQEDDKPEVWMQDAEYKDERLKGLVQDHRNNFTRRITTGKIVRHRRIGTMSRFESDDETYLIYDKDLHGEVVAPFYQDAFWQ